MQNLLTPASVALGILFGLMSAFFAHKRKRNPYLWLLIGFFFGMFGLFAVFLTPPKKKGRRRASPLKPVATEPAPPLVLGPADKFWYYLDPAHKQVGPMSYSAITKALLQGQISQTTYVWHENLTDWKKIKELNH